MRGNSECANAIASADRDDGCAGVQERGGKLGRHCLDIGLNPRLVNCQRFAGRVFFNVADVAGHVLEIGSQVYSLPH